MFARRKDVGRRYAMYYIDGIRVFEADFAGEAGIDGHFVE